MSTVILVHLTVAVSDDWSVVSYQKPCLPLVFRVALTLLTHIYFQSDEHLSVDAQLTTLLACKSIAFDPISLNFPVLSHEYPTGGSAEDSYVQSHEQEGEGGCIGRV
jgi:hypothetical protein